MKNLDYIPEDYKALRRVTDLSALSNAAFAPHENVLVCPRELKGDFEALAARLYAPRRHKKFGGYGYSQRVVLFSAYNRGARWDKADKAGDDPCVQSIQRDIDRFLASPRVREVELRLIPPSGYIRDSRVHDFHFDTNAERWMCCYSGAMTEYVRNEDAPSASVMNVRSEVNVRPEAQIYSFRPGDVWRQRNSDRCNTPFIHRAPAPKRGGGPRLVLVGDCRL